MYLKRYFVELSLKIMKSIINIFEYFWLFISNSLFCVFEIILKNYFRGLRYYSCLRV